MLGDKQLEREEEGEEVDSVGPAVNEEWSIQSPRYMLSCSMLIVVAQLEDGSYLVLILVSSFVVAL